MTARLIPPRIVNFVFDIDGCLALGEEPIAGAFESLAELRHRGCRLVMLTNDSQLSPLSWHEKAARMGFDLEDLTVITAGQILVQLAAARYPGGKALLFGSESIAVELRRHGLELVTGEGSEKADVVLVARSPLFSYDDMTAGLRALRAGAGFLTAGMGRAIPSSEGLLPGTGAIASSLAFAARRRPTIAGKPSALAAQVCMEIAGFDREETAFVGDDAELDVATAKRVGAFSVLVLTGATTREEVGALPPKFVPDLVTASVADIPALLTAS